MFNGRVGSDDLPTKAHTFYNSCDISKAREELSPVMRICTIADKCKREVIISWDALNMMNI